MTPFFIGFALASVIAYWLHRQFVQTVAANLFLKSISRGGFDYKGMHYMVVPGRLQDDAR